MIKIDYKKMKSFLYFCHKVEEKYLNGFNISRCDFSSSGYVSFDMLTKLRGYETNLFFSICENGNVGWKLIFYRNKTSIIVESERKIPIEGSIDKLLEDFEETTGEILNMIRAYDTNDSDK